jgi:hypothetical protein
LLSLSQEYKFVIVCDNKNVHWQPGNNHTIGLEGFEGQGATVKHSKWDAANKVTWTQATSRGQEIAEQAAKGQTTAAQPRPAATPQAAASGPVVSRDGQLASVQDLRSASQVAWTEPKSMQEDIDLSLIPTKELAAQIASLEKQIKEANSAARKAPLVARLQALMSTNLSAYATSSSLAGSAVNANASAGKASKPFFTMVVSPPSAAAAHASAPAAAAAVAYASAAAGKDVAAKIASLEKQIRDANSEARKAPLVAQLNALRSGAAYVPPPPVPVSQAKVEAKPFTASPPPYVVFSAPSSVSNEKEVAAKIASLEKQIKDANSDARKAPLIAQLNALRTGSPSSFSAPSSASRPASASAAFFSAPATGDKDLANKIASLEKQIKDANSDARKAPLIAQLNALRTGSPYSAPAPAPIRAAAPVPIPAVAPAIKAPIASYSSPVIGDKDLFAKIASLERQIKDANSDARKAPLIAQLNALRSGSPSSFSAPSSASRPASAPAASFSAPATGDKDLAAKIASLEKQIKDANSDARKAPLIAQLNALKSGSAFVPTAVARPSPTSFSNTASPSSNSSLAKAEAKAWSLVEDTLSRLQISAEGFLSKA